jgi:hypothetical protein
MSDIPPSIDTASLAERDAEIVTPDAIESILSDFRHWLVEAKDAPPVEPAPHLDVATVVQHFITLRQEVNLQTKSTRAQTEQSAQTVVLLQEALGELQRQQHLLEQNEESGQDELLRPLLKTLIDAFDALSLAEREVSKRSLRRSTPGSRRNPPWLRPCTSMIRPSAIGRASTPCWSAIA